MRLEALLKLLDRNSSGLGDIDRSKEISELIQVLLGCQVFDNVLYSGLLDSLACSDGEILDITHRFCTSWLDHILLAVLNKPFVIKGLGC